MSFVSTLQGPSATPHAAWAARARDAHVHGATHIYGGPHPHPHVLACSPKEATAPPPPARGGIGAKDTAQKIVFGGVGGVLGQAAVFPLYTAKTAVQNTPQLYPGGMRDALRRIAAGGARELYKGLRPVLAMTFPEKALKMAGNDLFRTALADEQGRVSLGRGMAAGAAAGLVQCAVTNPMELLMIAEQSAKKGGGAAPEGTVALARRIGLRGLYADAPATLLRDIPFSVIFFPLNAGLMTALAGGDEPAFHHTLAAGLLAGGTAGALSTPMDVVKTRVMAETGASAGKPRAVPQATRIVQVFGEVYRAHGAAGLFRGVGPRILIIAPLFSVTVSCFELLKNLKKKGYF